MVAISIGEFLAKGLQSCDRIVAVILQIYLNLRLTLANPNVISCVPLPFPEH